MRARPYLSVIVVGASVVLLSAGVKQAFGLFLQPITLELGTGREVFSLAMAIQNLVFGLPILAMLADRIGPRPVIVIGGLLLGTSFLLLPLVSSPAGLYLTLGLGTGFALSAMSYTVVLGAVAQVVPAERRSSAFGIITAAGSFGMFAVVRAVEWPLSAYGWAFTALLLVGLASLILVLAFGLPTRAGQRNTADPAEGGLLQAMLRARRNGSYWLLNAGFFVCGFHVAFIATHLPAFIGDRGLSVQVGASALSLIGLFNIFGSYLFGWLGDRYSKRLLLSGLYVSRAVVISLFLWVPFSSATALAFGAVIGFLWLATVPLTSGMVAQLFGSRYLSTLYGFVFLSHQLGAFLGVWLGGRIYDMTGSYQNVWLIAIALGLTAAVLHLPIREKPLAPRETLEAA